MLTQREIKSSYRFYLERTAHYYCIFGELQTLFNFHRGVAHGIGAVLGYEYVRIEEDVAEAIEKEKGGADHE